MGRERYLHKIVKRIMASGLLLLCLCLVNPIISQAVGVCWCTSSYDNQGGDKMFDGSYLTKWCAEKTWEFAYYIVWEKMYEPSRIASYTITTAGDTEKYPDRNPVSWSLYGSNTTSQYWGNNIEKWDLIDSRKNCSTLQASNYTVYNFNLSKPVDAYKYYYLRIEHDNDTYCIQIAELKFYDHVHNFNNNVCTSCGCRIGKIADDYGNALDFNNGNTGTGGTGANTNNGTTGNTSTGTSNNGGTGGSGNAGNIGGGSQVVTLTKPTLSEAANTGNSIKIKWNEIAKANGYQIYRKTGNGKYKKIKTVSGKLSYTDKNVSNGKKYSYKVRAYYKNGLQITYSEFSLSKTVKYQKSSLKLNKTSVTLKKNKTFTIKATVNPSAKVTYKSSNKKVATVSSKGKITARKKGTCKITVKANGIAKTVTVKVK